METRPRPIRFLLLILPFVMAGCMSDSSVTTSTDDELAALRASDDVECALGVDPALAGSIIASLAERVQALTDDGTLEGGDARSTEVHLTNASRGLSVGDFCLTREALESFRRQIDNLRRRGVLRDAQIATLLAPVRLVFGAAPMPGDIETMYAPGVIGELRTIQIGGDDFTYEVIDGLAIYQSDMILGYADDFEAGAGSPTPATGSSLPVLANASACQFYHFTCERWSDQTIGYAFADDWGSATNNAQMRSRIMQAISHWDSRTGMRFVPRSGGERLVFRNSTGCSSHVGRKVFTGVDPQVINLNFGCGLGAVIHEIAHAVGIYHEQSRNDRDDFVRVMWDNIIPGREHNFATHGAAARDVGLYEYGSLMQYSCTAFRRDGAGPTLEPVRPGVTCAEFQGDTLTATDVLGAYTLYPPAFSITGATPGQTADRFTLETNFTTKPVRNELVFWFSDRVPGWWAQGRSFSTGAAGLPQGENLITAKIIVAGEEILARSIRVVIEGEAPVVSLGPDRDVDLNRQFRVSPAVSDAEDGACAPTVCTYIWSPSPEARSGADAMFRFSSEGEQTIRVTVRDGSGRTGTDELTVNVVNSPPVAVIRQPSAGSTFPPGRDYGLQGHRLDINEGPDPGPGLSICGLTWSSSDASDAITTGVSADRRCWAVITYGDPGPRTITLTARDYQGLTDTETVDVIVSDCSSDCSPAVNITFSGTSDLDGSTFSPPFAAPGYYLSTEFWVEGRIFEGDDPPDNPMSYEWSVGRLCFGDACPDYLVLESGTVDTRPNWASTFFAWTPSDDIAPWTGCVLTPRQYIIRLRVTDSSGASTTTSREVYLACPLI